MEELVREENYIKRRIDRLLICSRINCILSVIVAYLHFVKATNIILTYLLIITSISLFSITCIRIRLNNRLDTIYSKQLELDLKSSKLK